MPTYPHALTPSAPNLTFELVRRRTISVVAIWPCSPSHCSASLKLTQGLRTQEFVCLQGHIHAWFSAGAWRCCVRGARP